jgi:hypothetical protein
MGGGVEYAGDCETVVLSPAVMESGSPLMTLDKEMEGYAHDCVRLAYLTADLDIREHLLQMAHEWMAAAASPPLRPRQTTASTESRASRPG